MACTGRQKFAGIFRVDTAANLQSARIRRKCQQRLSTFSTLCKGRLVPKEIEDRETVTRFLEAVGQFEKIMNDSGFVTLRRLTTDEITGTEAAAGIVEKYLSLSQHDTTVLKDIQLNPEEMRDVYKRQLKQSFGSGLREMCRTGFSVLRLAVR